MFRILKPIDYVIVVIFLLAIFIMTNLAFHTAKDPELVKISAADEEWLFVLDEDRIIKPLDEEGTCIIEIIGGNARVVESSCPQQICIRMGSIPVDGSWIACLPHNVFISLLDNSISVSSGIDAATY